MIIVARLVRSVVKIEALIDAVLLVPDLLLRLNEIVPLDEGAGIFILVIADALIPRLLVLLLKKQLQIMRIREQVAYRVSY